jgi:hypothetical protein
MNTHTKRIKTRPETTSLSDLSNHDDYDKERIALPLPPCGEGDVRFEMDVYARFMRHLRNVPNSRMDIKILSAIQFTADMMDTGDALIAKTLVDLGLKAPRAAFPLSFLDFVDKSRMRNSWEFGAPVPSILKLGHHWDKIGENRLSQGLPGQYTIFNENNYVTA